MKEFTLAEARQVRYGVWAGLPGGQPYQEGRCAEQVCDTGGCGFHFHQCNRKVPEGTLYCKQHDPERIAAKRKAREAKWDAEAAERKRDREDWELVRGHCEVHKFDGWLDVAAAWDRVKGKVGLR